MRTFPYIQKPTQEAKSVSSARPDQAFSGQSPKVGSILSLQRTIGNQAVQQLVQANTEALEAGATATASTCVAHDFSRIPLHARAHAGIQPKLAIGTPGDMYEQEADRVADQVMRMAEPQLQRTCARGGEAPGCSQEQVGNGQLQTKHIQEQNPGEATVLPVVAQVVSSPGQRLDSATREFMESRFGHDFSRVRVHTDARASESARAIDALAYTVDRDIVFGAGQFAPDTHPGRRLLAHELAHAVQSRYSPALQADTIRRQEGGAEDRRRECLREGLRRLSGQEPSQEQIDRQMDANREHERIFGRTVDPCAGLERLSAEPSVGANEVFPYPEGATLRLSELVTQSIPRNTVEGLINLAELLGIESTSLDTARHVAGILYGPDIPRGVNVTVEESTARVFRVSGTSPRIPASGGQAEIPPFDFSFSFEWDQASDTFEAEFRPEQGEVRRLDDIEVRRGENGRISLRIERLPGVDIPARIEIADGPSGSREIVVPELPDDAPSMLRSVLRFPLRLVGIEQVNAAEAAETSILRPPPSSPFPWALGLSSGMALSPDPQGVLGASWIYTFRPIGPLLQFPISLNLTYVAPRGVIGGASGGAEVQLPTELPMSIRVMGGLTGGGIEQDIGGVGTLASIFGPNVGGGFAASFGDVDVRVDYSAVINMLDEGPGTLHTFTLGSVINFR